MKVEATTYSKPSVVSMSKDKYHPNEMVDRYRVVVTGYYSESEEAPDRIFYIELFRDVDRPVRYDSDESWLLGDVFLEGYSMSKMRVDDSDDPNHIPSDQLQDIDYAANVLATAELRKLDIDKKAQQEIEKFGE